MKELAQIRAAVLKTLQESGIPAMEQFPEKRAESYSGAVATVGVGAASGKIGKQWHCKQCGSNF